MIKKLSLAAIALFAIIINSSAQEMPSQPVDYVNPLIGTQSDFSLSNGNTYPAIGLPYGMNTWTPQTGKNGDGWQYTYTAKKIAGIKQTHQPSPWINDYGCFSFMPMTGEPEIDPLKRASWFSHKSEISKPYYYSVYLADYDVTVEVTPTERAAIVRFTFGETDTALILIDGFHKGSGFEILSDENRVKGFSSYNSGGVPSNFKNHFVIEFDSEIISSSVWNDTIILHQNETQGKRTGAILSFDVSKNKTITARVASSFISPQQAALNLRRELQAYTFEEIKSQAAEAWNRQLGKIQVEGGSHDQLVTFFTALYRTLLFPRPLHEYDEANSIVHYSPYNGEVLPGYLYTDNGFWDTFRSAFPLSTILNPDLNSQMMQGLVNTYKESGWLPEWASPGHRDCMIGSNSASIIADSYLKGIRGYDIHTLYEAILKNSESEGPLSSVGRKGVSYYNQLGYIPYDVDVNENVARTLEYAYADFTIMKLAEALNRPTEEIEKFRQRALNYQHVFNKQTRFMQGRNNDGSWQEPFIPEKWGDAFTEGCSWHYTWSVFHDIAGLQKLMGGTKNFTAKLDSLFTAPPRFDYSYYGYQIHEITEMLIANMGQYAHGNQPVQHGIYLFNYAGEPWKTQYWVRETMNRLYTAAPDGLCGDEDNGQTSAWYVFSAMGFYPVCPGTGEYVLGAPLFKKVTINLSDGKQFIINAPDNNAGNRYTGNIKLDGTDYSKLFITHDQIMQGGQMDIQMLNNPPTARELKKSDLPYSLSE